MKDQEPLVETFFGSNYSYRDPAQSFVGLVDIETLVRSNYCKMMLENTGIVRSRCLLDAFIISPLQASRLNSHSELFLGNHVR